MPPPGAPPELLALSSSAEQQNWHPLRANVLLTGTPGVGKSSLARLLQSHLGLRHIDVGDFARERSLLAEHDVEHDAYYMHEDAVLDALEPIMTDGGVILDHHSCDWYPERWFNLVVVLRVSTETLYDRLEGRGYSQVKLDENVQAEIMQVVLEEAVASYPRVQVLQLQNDTEDDREGNIVKICRAYNDLNNARRASFGDVEEELGTRAVASLQQSD